VLLLLRGEIKMSPLPDFELLVRRVLQRWFDELTTDTKPGIRAVHPFIEKTTLAPSETPPGKPATCSCGAYWDTSSIAWHWQSDPATHALDFNLNEEDFACVTSVALESWATNPPAPCMDANCPHFKPQPGTGPPCPPCTPP
jgi:hypothetical protein